MRFSRFECEFRTAFVASHHLPDASDRSGRVPHHHEFAVVVGWSHEVSFAYGWTWDVDDVRAKVMDAVAPFRAVDLNTLFTVPTVEVVAAAILARLPAYFDSVSVSHRPDYVARITRRHLSAEWLDAYRVKS